MLEKCVFFSIFSTNTQPHSGKGHLPHPQHHFFFFLSFNHSLTPPFLHCCLIVRLPANSLTCILYSHATLKNTQKRFFLFFAHSVVLLFPFFSIKKWFRYTIPWQLYKRPFSAFPPLNYIYIYISFCSAACWLLQLFERTALISPLAKAIPCLRNPAHKTHVHTHTYTYTRQL